jgi:alpha-beta hydrolase superfamily lysophospholipase
MAATAAAAWTYRSATVTAAIVAIILALSPGFGEWQSANPPIARTNYHIFGTAGLAGQLHLPPPIETTPVKKEDEKDMDAKEATQSKPPVIVFALGMGLVQESEAMQRFVRAYNHAGFAVFTFDYATFGASQGLPRHQVHPQSHVRDLKAAIRYVKTLNSIDSSRVGLWGTSLGGGHVLLANASNKKEDLVQAVVSLVPHVNSGLEGVLLTIWRNPGPSFVALCSIFAALLEAGLFAVVGKTTYIPLHGEPGSAAMMQNPGDDAGYGKLVASAGPSWRNAATVSSVLGVLFYRPASQLSPTPTAVPTLIIAASNDTLCPAAAARNALRLIPNAQYRELPNTNHFDVYDGPVFTDVVDTSIAFYKKHL